MSLINESIICLITVLHLLVIIFIICTPFTDSNYLLLMHTIIIPFIIMHWYLNNNTCSLTVAEQYLRQKTTGKPVNNDDCFTYKFIAPIYDFNKNHEDFSFFTYTATIGLWLVSLSKLLLKYNNGKIQNFQDLVTL